MKPTIVVTSPMKETLTFSDWKPALIRGFIEGAKICNKAVLCHNITFGGLPVIVNDVDSKGLWYYHILTKQIPEAVYYQSFDRIDLLPFAGEEALHFNVANIVDKALTVEGMVAFTLFELYGLHVGCTITSGEHKYEFLRVYKPSGYIGFNSEVKLVVKRLGSLEEYRYLSLSEIKRDV